MNNEIDVTIMREYQKFSNETEKMLRDIYEERDIKNLSLPIDIEGVAGKLGFNIVINDIRLLGRLALLIGGKNIVISTGISYKEKRWVIAKAIALQHFGQSDAIIENSPFVPSTINGFSTDVFAMLLLLPISLFKQKFSEHVAAVTQLQYEFCRDQFLEHLTNISQIPTYHVSFAVHLISQMLAVQRQQAFKDVNYDISQYQEDEFENIYT